MLTLACRKGKSARLLAQILAGTVQGVQKASYTHVGTEAGKPAPGAARPPNPISGTATDYQLSVQAKFPALVPPGNADGAPAPPDCIYHMPVLAGQVRTTGPLVGTVCTDLLRRAAVEAKGSPPSPKQPHGLPEPCCMTLRPAFRSQSDERRSLWGGIPAFRSQSGESRSLWGGIPISWWNTRAEG